MGFQGHQNVLQKIRSYHKVLSKIAIRGFPLPLPHLAAVGSFPNRTSSAP